MTADWSAEIQSYLTYLQSAGCSRATLRLRAFWLGQLVARSPGGPWEVTPDALTAFVASGEHWAPETRKTVRSAVRGFYRWAEDTGRVPLDPARKLPTVRCPDGVPRPAPEAVFLGALAAADPRERLMLLLARYAGLRCGEVSRVHTRDVTSEGLRVRGKGGRTRVIPLHPKLAEALATLPTGYAFPGRIDGHLSPGYVSKLFIRLLGPGWSGHTLRHAFASRAYAGTRDLRAVQTLMGHTKPETTARYTLVPEASLIAAVQAAAS